ncbi:unnamed protein product, partial [Ectocarpus sp. 13 AM-2016]
PPRTSKRKSATSTSRARSRWMWGVARRPSSSSYRTVC